MSRLRIQHPDDMPEGQRALYDQMAAARPAVEPGRIGGPFDGWNRNPEIGRRVWQLGGAIRNQPSIERRYIELAILLTGQLWQAQYEWFAHEPMGRDAGLPENVIRSVHVGEEPTFEQSDDDGGDQLCWRFCRTLLAREKVEDELYAATRDRFGEAGVADLIHACGFYTLVCMTLNTFDVQLPDGAVPPFPA